MVSYYRGQIRHYRPTKFKNILPNSNLESLVAFSNQLMPRFRQKSRDTTIIAPKKQELKGDKTKEGTGMGEKKPPPALT